MEASEDDFTKDIYPVLELASTIADLERRMGVVMSRYSFVQGAKQVYLMLEHILSLTDRSGEVFKQTVAELDDELNKARDEYTKLSEVYNSFVAVFNELVKRAKNKENINEQSQEKDRQVQ